ncbi:MAG: GlxA family transcriptional regulator [Rhizobiales bacterium]|nr:GlxA family transcriptional regulator [Hyphomicrobiales bacterium]MBI3673100.1 GlxA family transcriptional regulator [Hyphomicrobiales bacterium]
MQASIAGVKQVMLKDTDSDLVRFGFLLLPEFPLYALIPAIEALRIANQNRGRKLYDWQLISVSGDTVKSCNGMSVTVDATIQDIPWFPTVIVFGGNHPVQQMSKRLLNWLRKLARHGSVLGGVDTGAFALAEAGLLDGHQATIHWESATTFADRFPAIKITEQLYTIDRDRITCAGGHATLDMMLNLIARRHGATLAQVVANAFIVQRIRRENEPQRLAAEHITGDIHSPLTRILHDMEENIKTPLTADRLAKRAGLSLRALSRVLRDRMGEPPMRYYRKIRLQAARNALFYSDVPIQDIAASCGFTSPEVFSRTFKEYFGVPPREFRRNFASDGLKRFRPELEQHLKN